MVEPVTVRLFVSTQTYDIPCDPRQPARWLLQQAKNIQRSNQSGQSRGKNEIQDELEVLYNRTRREVIDLDEPIGRCIAPMDVIDARSLRQTPDTTNANALFPWLRSYPGGPKVHDENLSSSNGLFFQQLYAYTLIGRRTPQTAMQRREKQKQEEFLDLLKAYVLGAFKDEPPLDVSHQNGYYSSRPPAQQLPTYYARPSTPPAPSSSALHGTSARRASDFPTSKGYFSPSTAAATSSTPAPVRRQIEYPPDQDSDSEADHADGSYASRYAMATPVRGRNSLPPMSPATATATAALAPSTPVRRATADPPSSTLDEMESVFDVVFKQQAIGMKLGSDESKQYAVVKECFDGSEAKKYPEIQNGVVILAVNGQEVSGLGLSRVLYRLREAPRPVVVRFGRIASRNDDARARMGTWG